MFNPLAMSSTVVALVLKNEIMLLRDYAFMAHKTLAFVTP